MPRSLRFDIQSKGPIHYHLNQNGYNVNGKVVIVLQPEPMTRLDGPPPGLTMASASVNQRDMIGTYLNHLGLLFIVYL